MGFEEPTPIQKASFSVILSGKDVVGIAQTGTGKTLAYMLPVLEELTFSKQVSPRILVVVPTRELVIQVVNEIEGFAKYMSTRVIGVYGGVNIKRQSAELYEGSDIIVATPGRLYDLIINQSLSVKTIKKLIIDEVDVMLDLGFKTQITNILELLPERRQNIMFSATMTEYVDNLIDDFFIAPTKISIAVSGTPLDNIAQVCYAAENFFTKVNLLKHLLKSREEFSKVLVFTSNKKSADRVFEGLEEEFGEETCIIHSNKSQNYRIRSIEEFDTISHVINLDVPAYPENYMHRIGRTGRAEREGNAILMFTEKEQVFKSEIEQLMSYRIPEVSFPREVAISKTLLPEEQPVDAMLKNENRNEKGTIKTTTGLHEKKEKNKKVNLGNSKKNKKKRKYKKPQTRGDKTYHKRQKRG